MKLVLAHVNALIKKRGAKEREKKCKFAKIKKKLTRT